jgi:hypothetical protein
MAERRRLDELQHQLAAAQSAVRDAEARRRRALAVAEADAGTLDALRGAVAAGARPRDVAAIASAIRSAGIPAAAVADAVRDLGSLKKVCDRERARAARATAAADAAERRQHEAEVAAAALERRAAELEAEVAEAIRSATAAARGAFEASVAGAVPAAEAKAAAAMDAVAAAVKYAGAAATEHLEAATATARDVAAVARDAADALADVRLVAAARDGLEAEVLRLQREVREQVGRVEALGFVLAEFEEAGPDGAPRLRLRHPAAVGLAAALLFADIRDRGDADLPHAPGVASWASITLAAVAARLSALADADPRPRIATLPPAAASPVH